MSILNSNRTEGIENDKFYGGSTELNTFHHILHRKLAAGGCLDYIIPECEDNAPIHLPAFPQAVRDKIDDATADANQIHSFEIYNKTKQHNDEKYAKAICILLDTLAGPALSLVSGIQWAGGADKRDAIQAMLTVIDETYSVATPIVISQFNSEFSKIKAATTWDEGLRVINQIEFIQQKLSRLGLEHKKKI